MTEIRNHMLTFIHNYKKTAIVYGDSTVSYSELIRIIKSYTGLFILQKGERGAIFSENRPEWIYSLYSIWLNKGIAVPLDYSLPKKELLKIIEDSKPSFFFCSRSEEDNLRNLLVAAGLNSSVIIFEDIIISDNEVAAEDIIIDYSDETALLMYTSGTTGEPKGVMLSYDNIMTSIRGIYDLRMITENDRMVALLPFYHIFPLQGGVTAPLYAGVTIHFIKTLQANEILKVLKKYRITMFLGVPRIYEMFHSAIIEKINRSVTLRIIQKLLRKSGLRMPGRIIFFMIHRAFGGHIHSYLTGGAAIDPDVMKDLVSLGFRIVEGYGATEAGPLIAFNPFSKVKPGSVGLPMPGTEVQIRNGEIVARGKNIMKGYYGRPDYTENVMKHGWYHTGDSGYFDKDRYLYITGRIDEVIILSNGKKLFPASIEKSLIEITSLIKEAGVVLYDNILTAVLNPDYTAFDTDKEDEIEEEIKIQVVDKYNSSVPDYLKIRRFKITVSELPRTRLGKLKRYLLSDLVIPKTISRTLDDEPDYIEYRLIRDYLKKLKSREVFYNNRFDFDLALDSLDMVELISYIESVFGVKIAPEYLAKYSTPKSLAELIRMSKTRIKNADIDWRKILIDENKESLAGKRLGVRLTHLALDRVVSRYFNLEVSGIADMPKQPFIIVPNHQSYIDVPLIGSAMPLETVRNTFFIVKQSRIMSKFVAMFTLNRNIIVVDAEKNVRESMQKAAAVLLAGKNIMIFPEGIRTRDGKIQPFRKSFAILGSVLSVPIVPVAVTGAYESMPPGAVFPGKGSVKIHFAPPIYPEEKNVDDIVDETMDIIKALMSSGN